MKRKKPLIGYYIFIPEHVRKEYLNNRGKPPVFVIVEIHRDKLFGATAKIFQRNSIFDRRDEIITKAERKRFSNRLKKIKPDEPLDTSKWVKPDEETIRNALVESLFALEILKEDSINYSTYYGKAQAFYSLLHGHSPRNPQTLGNWVIDPYFQKIMAEFKSDEHKKYWKSFMKDLDRINKSKDHWKKRRKEYQIWKKGVLKKMIIKDPKPPKYKDIFKDYKRKLKIKKEVQKNE